MARCDRHDKEMVMVCGAESCGLCYEESLAPPPPWACYLCHLVNWPWGDGSPRTQCSGCGYSRELGASLEAEDLAVAEALAEREAFVERLERVRTMTYAQFMESDPWEV